MSALQDVFHHTSAPDVVKPHYHDVAVPVAAVCVRPSSDWEGAMGIQAKRFTEGQGCILAVVEYVITDRSPHAIVEDLNSSFVTLKLAVASVHPLHVANSELTVRRGSIEV